MGLLEVLSNVLKKELIVIYSLFSITNFLHSWLGHLNIFIIEHLRAITLKSLPSFFLDAVCL